MAKVLRELIGGKEPSFSLRIRHLESATGNRTVDIGLASEVLSRLHGKVKALGLDPLDTTHEELHASLKQKVLRDDALLRRSYHSRADTMIDALNAKAPTVQIPVFKNSSLRKCIKAVPPKKTMSALAFRSVESLLKRTDIDQILLGAFSLESLTWHRAFSKQLKKLTLSDVTTTRPKVVFIDQKITSAITRPPQPVLIQCAGLAGLPTAELHFSGGWLQAAGRACESLYLVHQRGVYLKLHRFQEDFIMKMILLTYAPPSKKGKVGDIQLPWQPVYIAASSDKHVLQTVDEATTDPRDFFWRYPSEALPLIHRQIDFWADNDIIGKPGLYTISLNINDIALDTAHLVPYMESTNASLSRMLSAELLARYLRESPERQSVLKQFGLAL